jgi:hypothetical protein
MRASGTCAHRFELGGRSELPIRWHRLQTSLLPRTFEDEPAVARNACLHSDLFLHASFHSAGKSARSYTRLAAFG